MKCHLNFEVLRPARISSQERVGNYFVFSQQLGIVLLKNDVLLQLAIGVSK